MFPSSGWCPDAPVGMRTNTWKHQHKWGKTNAFLLRLWMVKSLAMALSRPGSALTLM
jgi:hypothetical protein